MTGTEAEKLDAILARCNLRLRTVLRHHHTHRNRRLDFNGREYLKALYLDENPLINVMKATQCGVSEWAYGMKAIAPAIDGRNVFYVYPTFALASRAVRGRVDRTIEFTPFYREVLKASRVLTTKQSESMFLKHLGPGAIAFAGSNTSSVFTEFAADDLVVDEEDECDQENLEMAPERLSESVDRNVTRIGQPSVSGVGMARRYFKESDRKRWHIRCSCGRWQVPEFFRHVVRRQEDGDYLIRDSDWEPGGSRDARLFCDCGRPLDRYAPGEWVAERRAPASGYQISKLFSTRERIADMIDRFNRGLANPTVMKRFYNGDLGLPFEMAGSKITREEVLGAIGMHGMGYQHGTRCVLGCDVGSQLYVVIGELSGSRLVVRLMRAFGSAELADFKELARLYREYHCVAGVIDALPEQRLSKRFARSFRGAFYCFYGEVKRDMVDPEHKIVTVDRTGAIDAVREGLLTGELLLPREAEGIPEVVDHFTALTRVMDEKRGRFGWLGDEPDHYLHAADYMLVAKRLLSMAA